jgi:hypothetical protein
LSQGILGDHERQAEFAQAFTGQRHADNTAGVPNHEGQRRGRGFLGGKNQVSLVFAIRVIGHHHEFTRGDGCESGLDTAEDRIPVQE